MYKKVQYKRQTALFLASTSLLIFGGASLYINGGITYTSILASCTTVIPAVTIMYCLGWLIGLIIESSKIVKKVQTMGYTNSLLEEILKEEGLSEEDLESSDMSIDVDENAFDNIEPESKE